MGRVLLFRILRCPSGATSRCSGGMFAHAWILGPRAVRAGRRSRQLGPARVNTDIVYLVAHASPLSPRASCAILLLFSAMSWGVILYKSGSSAAPRASPATFLEVFRKSSKFSEVQAVCRTLPRARWSGSSSPATPS